MGANETAKRSNRRVENLTPTLSARGREEIIFRVCRLPCDENTASTAIKTVTPDGGNLRTVANFGEMLKGSAHWSPDGSQIVFVKQEENSTDDDTDDLWIMGRDGTDSRAVTSDQVSSSEPDWSHDGSRLVYVHDDWENADLHVIDIDGTSDLRLTDNNVQESSPDWSPDGREIVFTVGPYYDDDIFVIDADGTHRQRLTSAEDVTDAVPSWSPDGRWIVFSRYKTERAGWDVYKMSADGGNVTRLTRSGADERAPRFSPDGRWIVFTRGRKIFKVRIDGSRMQEVFRRRGALLSGPDWGPAAR
jgi:TolB protein